MRVGMFGWGMVLVVGLVLSAELMPAAHAEKPVNAKKFDAAAAVALTAMKQKAAELNIQGVAVVSFAPGEAVAEWSSRMVVVGRLTDPKASANGNNLLGIAYAKSAEMARTLKDSGTAKWRAVDGGVWMAGRGGAEGEGRVCDCGVQRWQVRGRCAGFKGRA